VKNINPLLTIDDCPHKTVLLAYANVLAAVFALVGGADTINESTFKVAPKLADVPVGLNKVSNINPNTCTVRLEPSGAAKDCTLVMFQPLSLPPNLVKSFLVADHGANPFVGVDVPAVITHV